MTLYPPLSCHYQSLATDNPSSHFQSLTIDDPSFHYQSITTDDPSFYYESLMPDEQPFPYQFESGLGPFAEALHNAFRYKIRCPTCPGNPRQPGHNKDTAGKTNASGNRL
jgi:hypothetical protein